MRIGDTLKKAASLIVDFDDNELTASDGSQMTSATNLAPDTSRLAPRTVEQIVRESPGPNLDEIKVPETAPKEPVIGMDGKVNYPAIYRMANLPESPFTAEQVLELLAALPTDLPIESKRTTLKVTFNAMSKTTGVTPETVVADASRKLAALAAYAQSFTQQANQYVATASTEIARLEAEIVRHKQGIEDAKSKSTQMVQACQLESDRLDDVLEFFSKDLPPSRYAAPA